LAVDLMINALQAGPA